MKQSHALADYSRVLFELMELAQRATAADKYATSIGMTRPVPVSDTAMVAEIMRAVPIFWHREMLPLLSDLMVRVRDHTDDLTIELSDLLFPDGFVLLDGSFRFGTANQWLGVRWVHWVQGAMTAGAKYPAAMTISVDTVNGHGVLRPYADIWGIGQPLNEITTPLKYGDQDLPDIVPQDARMFTRLMFWCVVQIMKQRLVTVTPARPNRAARKLVESRIPFEPQIQVITLRRPANPQPRDEHSTIDWKCRWIVRAHWRMQRVGPDRSEVKPVLVNAYVKGPENKPLRPSRPTLVRVAA